jgi:putative Mg2+ transporter-C (MgtC) family protein
MLLNPGPGEIALRILLACVAGALVGFNRESRNQAAGLRTTVLVCLAACVAMVLANLLLTTSGKQPNGFAQIDPMRLPLGVLSGMGFLGAGAILKRGDAVQGVTTAATLWLMTMVGLCFGAGEHALGAGTTAIAFGAIWGLKRADDRMHRKQNGSISISADSSVFPEAELRRAIMASDLDIVSWAISFKGDSGCYQADVATQWHGPSELRTRTPDLVERLAGTPGVLKVDWRPQVLSG